MKLRNVNLERPDILGRRTASAVQAVGNTDLENWRRRLGYFSLFAGVATVCASQAQNVFADESKKGVPPRVAKRAAELLKNLNTASCSKPELLRRQSEYRLPGQKGEFNMVELFAGSDTCPGTPVPPGNYTSGAPYIDMGSTTGANNTVNDIPMACNGLYNEVAGPDHIYSFTLTARGANPQIRVSTTSPTYDLSIYILNGSTGAMCPAGTGNNVTNCLVGADSAFFPASEEVLDSGDMNSLPLNVPLHFFVDSYYSGPGGGGATSNGPYTVRIQDVTVGGGVTPPENDAPVDMNGDGRSDYVVIRNAGGPTGQLTWWTMFQDGFPSNSTSLPTSTTDWGIASDQPVPADFDGDGKDDFAVFRPGTQGVFYIVRSATSTLFSEPFGITGDDATVVGDYTGDNVDDLAVYRSGATPADPSTWFYRSIGSPPGVQSVVWGQGGDFPAPGDYDGDDRYDFVVQRTDFNGVNGRFWVREADGLQYSVLFGLATDSVVPGDYDDDGITDFAVARDDNGMLRWDFEPSGTAGITVVSDIWGVSATDWIAQGDYDGDGRTDYAVWRPGNPGLFYVMTVGDRVISIQPWGEPGDLPAANYNEH